jgi:TorA maturation chaperone TorD
MTAIQTESPPPAPPAVAPLDAEDQARADLYSLTGSLLLGPPDAGLLAALAQADPLPVDAQTASPLDRAWENLRLSAIAMDELALKEEYTALFISTGTPLLNPYESLYVAGYMMDKPLARLRADLQQLGLQRRSGAFELEDHLGALCETMRILILEGRSVDVQKAFFENHIAAWSAPCLQDLRSAPGANFTRHLADFADAFFAIEREAFEMETEHASAEGSPA